MKEIVFKNAGVVLPGEIIKGSVVVAGGKIRDVARGDTRGPGEDLGGDYLIPGLIELHTDHLESHLQPRPKVRWPAASAVAAFDAQVAASGITTVFDCIRAGRDIDHGSAKDDVLETLGALQRAGERGLLRAEHRLHVRCEVCVEDVIEITTQAVSAHSVHLISLMDHTPGARQFRAMELWRIYYGGKTGLPEPELNTLIARKLDQYARNYARHRSQLVALAKQNGIVLASHDDTTIEHVQELIADEVAIAEFPTTVEAAKASHEAGLKVVMGAPNIVRGGSHSGNVAGETLAREGVLDILSSDYVPASLLLGAFRIAQRVEGVDLPAALRTVTVNPARATRLDDRGEIAVGKRADLVRVRLVDDMPMVREVYREGNRVV